MVVTHTDNGLVILEQIIPSAPSQANLCKQFHSELCSLSYPGGVTKSNMYYNINLLSSITLVAKIDISYRYRILFMFIHNWNL